MEQTPGHAFHDVGVTGAPIMFVWRHVFEIASPAFFRTLGIEIVRGRAFTDEDSAGERTVLILSESAARLAWPDKDALGERLKISGSPWATVIGVATDTRYRELTAIRPTV